MIALATMPQHRAESQQPLNPFDQNCTTMIRDGAGQRGKSGNAIILTIEILVECPTAIWGAVGVAST